MVLLTSFCAMLAFPAIASQPNIVLIYVDDWGWNGTPIQMDERMQNSGMPGIIEMPHVEKLAEDGIVFRNAYGSPQCSPARASVLTGQSNPHNGYTVFMNGSDYYDSDSRFAQFPIVPNGSDSTLDPETVTIPEALAELGYVSALYGKWHNRGNPEDEFGVGNAPTPPAGIDGSDQANKPGQTIAGTSLDGITDPKLMSWITDRGLAFMEQQVADGKPFFLMLSHYAMHEGRECFPESRARFQNIPEIVAYNKGKTDPAEISRRQDPAVWLGMAYELDLKIGEVMQKLEDLGVADNTYIVVVSDNGYRESFFDELFNLPQPLHAHKWWLWQGGIRVPMIVTGPGIEAGSRCTANVVNYDFLPTFYEWGGGDPETLTDIDGISLAGLLEGESASEDFLNRSLYFHYPHYRDNMPHSVIVKGQEKVVYFYDTPVLHPDWEPIMYFDLSNDVGEYNNIFPQNPERAQVLYEDLSNYLALVGARIPRVPNPDYDPAAYEADRDHDNRILRGAFIGTREPEPDEKKTP
jgi:arylsulfatase A-like enzyme